MARRPLYFAKTSGTTSGTKIHSYYQRITAKPYKFRKAPFVELLLKKRKIKPFLGKVMFQWDHQILKRKTAIKIGRLSGIVNHHKPLFSKKKSLPNKKTNQIQKLGKKIDQIAEETIGRDLRIIGGTPP